MKHYIKNGLDIREDELPDGYVIVDEYHPCPTTTPWDYQGTRHQRQYTNALQAAGVDSVSLRTVMTILHPRGTGPGGRVRAGDNMTPGVYRIAVLKEMELFARAAIANHRAAIEAWLHNNGPFPEECKG
jgi:hypothetical protein